jgi:hypothetical protein
MASVKIALTAGLVLLALGVCAVLVDSPMSLARINRSTAGAPQQPIAQTSARASYCQARETLPARTLAIRVSLQASIGPRVRLTVSSDRGALTTGEQGRGWNGDVVSVPVRPLAREHSGVTVCVTFQAQNELLTLRGRSIPGMAASYDAHGPLAGSMRLEYLRAGTRSWASLIPTIARDMGLGRAFEGPAVVYAALALVLAIVLLASRLLLEELS